ncbi:hypothetical protein BJ970_004269 [Saccharopolyspora phatthalungensis]|uniref:Uncharacterized protein n=1 Tax=Saccharopolyspora phatthalungensis TaxID=664693 RepID=A0A840QE36_9PSEU|nr:hypothetical protein [Saccharopolyspora phatthalungensis]
MRHSRPIVCAAVALATASTVLATPAVAAPAGENYVALHAPSSFSCG